MSPAIALTPRLSAGSPRRSQSNAVRTLRYVSPLFAKAWHVFSRNLCAVLPRSLPNANTLLCANANTLDFLFQKIQQARGIVARTFFSRPSIRFPEIPHLLSFPETLARGILDARNPGSFCQQVRLCRFSGLLPRRLSKVLGSIAGHLRPFLVGRPRRRSSSPLFFAAQQGAG